MDLRAVIFMPALVGAVVFGFVFVLFTAHYYLTILEGTGTGSKEVTWMSEPILDNFWKLWYMLWMFGLWFGPAYFIGRSMGTTQDTWVKLAIPIAVVWLCYPVSQLSSLSASSIWLPIVPDVFARLAQKPAVTLGFYLLSLPVVALFGVSFKWAFLTKGEWHLLFIGAPLTVLALFLYARLIGRLAFVLKFTKSIFRETKKPKVKKEEDPTERPDAYQPTSQPSELPPLASPDGELTGYDLTPEDDDRPRKKRLVAEIVELESEVVNPSSPEPDPPPLPRHGRHTSDSSEERARGWTDDDDDDGPRAYGVYKPEVDVTENTPREVVQPSAEEVRLLSRDDVPKKPRRAWGPELLAFLAQPGTISALVISSGLCSLIGVLVRIARDFNPLD